MADYNNITFYSGAGYGISGYNEPFINTKYRFAPSEFGLPTDPRTANQIKAVSDKLSTGARVIEVSGVSPEMFEALPQQHLKEINRLKKLAGAELTFHGPLVEPTGVIRRGWDESQRAHAERQMWSAVERSHDLEPKGNIVVTFHSSNGLPDPEVKEYVKKDGKDVEEIKQIWVVDERTGDFQPSGPPQKEYLTKEGKYLTPYEVLEKQNKDAWTNVLQNVNYHAYLGTERINQALKPIEIPGKDKKIDEETILNFYKEFGSEEAEKKLALLGEQGKHIKEQIQEISHGDIYLRDAYTKFQTLFNQAYAATEKSQKSKDEKERQEAEETLKRLNKFREEIKDKVDYLEKPEKVRELGEELIKGVNILGSIPNPKLLRPLKEFAIDKASDTFSNLAFDSYKKFKETAPIISIENPPAGSGLTRADELKSLVEESRNKFVEKAHKELGMSKSEAKAQADKLIGVTWDVGHINMLRKYGAEERHLVKETETIAPFVKHVHLSDNFGMEHTELPMGMGNVPTKKMLDLISEYNKKAKKIIETGGPWYQFFQKSPLRETFEAFGSPVYPMKMAPYWNQVAATSGGYFSGYGKTLPDIHFSTYGAGFSQLPAELGGQIAGRGGRLSGTPME